MTAYCSNCGIALPPAARFCSVCGTVVAGGPVTGFPPYAQPFAPRLLRPVHGRQFAGVCAAFARSYGWDIALLRILAVVLGIFVFPIPEIFYIAAWIGIPDEATVGMVPPVPPAQF
jgi:phage shock protein PspC (stress-responsive transcriptional regulator)